MSYNRTNIIKLLSDCSSPPRSQTKFWNEKSYNISSRNKPVSAIISMGYPVKVDVPVKSFEIKSNGEIKLDDPRAGGEPQSSLRKYCISRNKHSIAAEKKQVQWY